MQGPSNECSSFKHAVKYTPSCKRRKRRVLGVVNATELVIEKVKMYPEGPPEPAADSASAAGDANTVAGATGEVADENKMPKDIPHPLS